MLRIGRILIPTDFAAASQSAFELACSLARDHGGRVLVLHVAELPIVASSEVMIHPPPGGVREAISEQLHNIKPPFAGVPVDYRLEEGNPVTEILRVARESECDLIVMGSHGRTGLAHLLMGCVAEPVVRRAVCPVLVVKTPFAPKSNA